jgi:hypothetical protein
LFGGEGEAQGEYHSSAATGFSIWKCKKEKRAKASNFGDMPFYLLCLPFDLTSANIDNQINCKLFVYPPFSCCKLKLNRLVNAIAFLPYLQTLF